MAGEGPSHILIKRPNRFCSSSCRLLLLAWPSSSPAAFIQSWETRGGGMSFWYLRAQWGVFENLKYFLWAFGKCSENALSSVNRRRTLMQPNFMFSARPDTQTWKYYFSFFGFIFASSGGPCNQYVRPSVYLFSNCGQFLYLLVEFNTVW